MYYDWDVVSIPQNVANDIIYLMGAVSNTKNSPLYHHIQEEIRKHYDPKRQMSNTSVGALFHGYLVPVTINDPGLNKVCTPLCAGSLSPDGFETKCKEHVFYAKMNAEGFYNFYSYNKESSTNPNAIIFLPESPKFNGFTQEEIVKLKESNVRKCKVYTASSNPIVYNPLYNDFVDVDTLATLDQQDREIINSLTIDQNGLLVGNGSNNGSSSKWGWFLLVVIIIIILLFGFLACKRR
jgi:hypothetical protein